MHNISTLCYRKVGDNFSFVPIDNFVDIEIADDRAFGGSAGMESVQVYYFQIDTVNYTPQTVVTTITSGDDYHYGFNGKYKDNEWAGLGNNLDFGARMYDSRIARFRSIDPLTHKSPGWSPYSYAQNNPIFFIDKDGLVAEKPATQSHKTFLRLVGIEVYLQARNRGYSVHGAAVILALAANESGYADFTTDKYAKGPKTGQYKKEALEYNNFFGMKGSLGLAAYSNPDIPSGVKRGLDNLEGQYYKGLKEILSTEVFDPATLGEPLKKYNHSGISFEKYGPWLEQSVAKGAAGRLIVVLNEAVQAMDLQLGELSKQKVASPLSITDLSKNAELQGQIDKLTTQKAEYQKAAEELKKLEL